MAIATREKPKKPTKDFALFPHANGQWAKKIRGDLHYFGPWSDPQAALRKYLSEKDDLQAGRTPPTRSDALTVADLVNDYLEWKEDKLTAGEIAPRTFADCDKACGRIVEAFGRNRLVEDLRPENFAALRGSLSKTLGPVALKVEITRVRSVFTWGYEMQYLDRPVRYGPAFDPPAEAVLRKEREKRGERMIEAPELRRLIDAGGVPMKAMILLACNTGLGNRDIALLPITAVNLDRAWVRHPRPKTGIRREAPLWPETVEAIRVTLEQRPEPRSPKDADLLFLTRLGCCWVEHSDGERKAWKDSIGLAFGKLLRSLELKRDGCNFYSLRHVFRTVADETLDTPAIDRIMGHAPPQGDMAAAYRERISDERLRAVVDHVRAWLWPDAKPTKPAAVGNRGRNS